MGVVNLNYVFALEAVHPVFAKSKVGGVWLTFAVGNFRVASVTDVGGRNSGLLQAKLTSVVLSVKLHCVNDAVDN